MVLGNVSLLSLNIQICIADSLSFHLYIMLSTTCTLCLIKALSYTICSVKAPTKRSNSPHFSTLRTRSVKKTLMEKVHVCMLNLVEAHHL